MAIKQLDDVLTENSYIEDSPEWVEQVYEIAEQDYVHGGLHGYSNVPHEQLANRTAYLRNRIKTVEDDIELFKKQVELQDIANEQKFLIVKQNIRKLHERLMSIVRESQDADEAIVYKIEYVRRTLQELDERFKLHVHNYAGSDVPSGDALTTRIYEEDGEAKVLGVNSKDPNKVRIIDGVKAQSGVVQATTFVGNLQGNATSASKLNKTIHINVIGDMSGNTTTNGSADITIPVLLNTQPKLNPAIPYGPDMDMQLDGTIDNFYVPYFEVNSKGLITTATNRKMYLPDTTKSKTAGAMQNMQKLFIIGAQFQDDISDTYSQHGAYIYQDHVYSHDDMTVTETAQQAIINKTYEGYVLGDACAAGIDTTIGGTKNSNDLITSDAVARHTHIYAGSDKSGGAATHVKITVDNGSEQFPMVSMPDSETAYLNTSITMGPNMIRANELHADEAMYIPGGKIWIDTSSDATGTATGILADYHEKYDDTELKESFSEVLNAFEVLREQVDTNTLSTNENLIKINNNIKDISALVKKHNTFESNMATALNEFDKKTSKIGHTHILSDITDFTNDVDKVDGCHAGNDPGNVLKLDNQGFIPLKNLTKHVHDDVNDIPAAKVAEYIGLDADIDKPVMLSSNDQQVRPTYVLGMKDDKTIYMNRAENVHVGAANYVHMYGTTAEDMPVKCEKEGTYFSGCYKVAGYPAAFGNIITMDNPGKHWGGSQLFLGWSGLNTDDGKSEVAKLYYRNRRDINQNWSKWSEIAFTDSHMTGSTEIANLAKKTEGNLILQIDGVTKQTFDGSEDITFNIDTSKTKMAEKVKNPLTLMYNGIAKYVYDGSANIDVNITPNAIGAAEENHGNHVPDIEFANNAKFLRCDNTWYELTLDDINAADKGHVHNYAGADMPNGPANDALQCSGNSATASQLKTKRNIKIDGIIKGNADFDGSSNITINVTGKDWLETKGGVLTGALEIQGTTSVASCANNGGAFSNHSANLILHGDPDYGTSGIVLTSSKENDSINMPEDRAFIQYYPMGVEPNIEGTAPTKNISGNASKLVIGVGSSDDDILYLQAQGKAGIHHISGKTDSIILDSNNYTDYVSKIGTADLGDINTPIYLNKGVPEVCTGLKHSLSGKTEPKKVSILDNIDTNNTIVLNKSFTDYDKVMIHYRNDDGLSGFIKWDAWELKFALDNSDVFDLLQGNKDANWYIYGTNSVGVTNRSTYIKFVNSVQDKQITNMFGRVTTIIDIYGITY